MTIKVPKWAVGIDDQGANVFLAFALRVCDIYGYDTQYYISKDDVSRMCNKTPQGIIEWLRRYPQIEDNMQIGDILQSTMIFQIKAPRGYKQKPKHKHITKGLEVELTDVRYQMAWVYLLGCLNHNIISENFDMPSTNNTFNIKTFHITREAGAYMKVAERQAMREKYDDMK